MHREVLKLLNVGIIYSILDGVGESSSSSPKKWRIIVIKNNNNVLIPKKTVMAWQVCLNYWRLIGATWKYHNFIEGYSRNNQIVITHEAQE